MAAKSNDHRVIFDMWSVKMIYRKSGLFLMIVFSFTYVNSLMSLSTCAHGCRVAGRFALDTLKAHKEAIIGAIAAQLVVTSLVMFVEKGKAFALGDPTRSRAFEVQDYKQCPHGKGLIAPETVHPEVNQLIQLINHPEPLIEMNRNCEGKITVDRGMLLCGPNASGKTEHAFKFAKEIGAPVLYANAAVLVDAAQGSGAKAIHDYFKRAAHRSIISIIKNRFLSALAWLHIIRQRHEKPTVAIIENVQAIARPRESDIRGDDAVQKLEREKTFDQLLYELDKLQDNNVLPNVFFIGISNFPLRILDSALGVRPQRARMVELSGRLNDERRKQILKYHRNRFLGCRFAEEFDSEAGFDNFVAEVAQTNNPGILRQTIETAVSKSAFDNQPVTRQRLDEAYQSLRRTYEL